MLCPTINLLNSSMLQEVYFPACCCSSCCICCSAWLESSAKRMPTRAECFMNFSQHFCTHCMHNQQSGSPFCSGTQQERKVLKQISPTQCFHEIPRHKSGLQDDQIVLSGAWGTARDLCTVKQQASRSLAFSSVPSRSLLLKLSTQSVKHFCTRELYIRRLHAQTSP